MSTTNDNPSIDADFRPQVARWIAYGSVVLVSPFAVSHFVHQRTLLGVITLCMIGVLGFNAWYLRRPPAQRLLAPRLVIAALGIAVDLYLLATQGMSGLLWGYPTVLWLYATLPERPARIANLVLLAGSLPLIWVLTPPEVALRAVVTLIGVSVFTFVLVHVISRQQEGLQRQLRHDPLTGLLNRHTLGDVIRQALARTARDGVPMALLAIDLDHFKGVNDDFGHAGGDEVLRGLGALLRERLRATDIAFRLGGEEFLVLLHDTDAQHARQVADSLLSEIRNAPLLDARPVTASIGLAPLGDERDTDAWIAHADQALYRAKRGGRDRVEVREQASPTPLPRAPDTPRRHAEKA